MQHPAKPKLKLERTPTPPQLSLASKPQGADHPLIELARLLARRAARQRYQDQMQERAKPGS